MTFQNNTAALSPEDTVQLTNMIPHSIQQSMILPQQ